MKLVTGYDVLRDETFTREYTHKQLSIIIYILGGSSHPPPFKREKKEGKVNRRERRNAVHWGNLPEEVQWTHSQVQKTGRGSVVFSRAGFRCSIHCGVRRVWILQRGLTWFNDLPIYIFISIEFYTY